MQRIQLPVIAMLILKKRVPWPYPAKWIMESQALFLFCDKFFVNVWKNVQTLINKYQCISQTPVVNSENIFVHSNGNELQFCLFRKFYAGQARSYYIFYQLS